MRFLIEYDTADSRNLFIAPAAASIRDAPFEIPSPDAVRAVCMDALASALVKGTPEQPLQILSPLTPTGLYAVVGFPAESPVRSATSTASGVFKPSDLGLATMQVYSSIFIGGTRIERPDGNYQAIVCGPNKAPPEMVRIKHPTLRELVIFDSDKRCYRFWCHIPSGGCYPAPLPNVHETGLCCTGIPSSSLVKLMHAETPQEYEQGITSFWEGFCWNSDLMTDKKYAFIASLVLSPDSTIVSPEDFTTTIGSSPAFWMRSAEKLKFK